MGLGGVSKYAAINAHVRSMYSTMLTAQDYARLDDAPDFETLINLLKQTTYGPYLDRAKDKDLSPRRAAFQIRERLADAYTTIINTAPVETRKLLVQLYRSFEVDNLKAVLRGIVAGLTYEQVRFLLFPLGSVNTIPAEAMMETRNVSAAIELMRGTPYYDTLSFALKRYSSEGTLFPIEVALDLNYWRDLWNSVSQLTGEDRSQAMRVIGPLLDMTNLMWAIRYRVYHHLSEEEIINYTLSTGYRVRDDDIRSIAIGADIGQVVSHIFPDLTDVDALLANPRAGLQELETRLTRQVVARCRAAFSGNPFNIGIPLAFLVLLGYEIQDLTVLIEAKASHIPAESYRPYLLLAEPTRA